MVITQHVTFPTCPKGNIATPFKRAMQENDFKMAINNASAIMCIKNRIILCDIFIMRLGSTLHRTDNSVILPYLKVVG